MEKEDFINNILNSADGIKRVTPNDAIFQKIEQRIDETTISIKYFWFIAASIVILISFNLLLLGEKSNLNEIK